MTNITDTVRKTLRGILVCAGVLLAMTGCGYSAEKDKAPALEGLTFEKELKNSYATQYKITAYTGGYKLIEIRDGEKLLAVPKGKACPKNLPEDILPVLVPAKNIYLVSSSAMALFNACKAEGAVSFLGTPEKNWRIPEVKEAMAQGKIRYAGKYSAPDYEMLIDNDVRLAIENTMIYHSPETKEKLEELGIHVFVEKSSYEKHPLGKTEWMKVYGILTGHEKAAEEAFKIQEEKVEMLEKDKTDTEKKVAFFFINSKGNVVTYKSDTYVPAMIAIAGGTYLPKDRNADENRLSIINMTLEDFYSGASDADVLIYNASIAGELKSLEEFKKLSPVLAEFDAVKNGHVWCTGKNLYQETDKLGDVIANLHEILADPDAKDTKYLYRLR